MDEDIEALDERTEDNRKDCDHILDSLKALEERVVAVTAATTAATASAVAPPLAADLRHDIEAGLRHGLRQEIEASLRQEIHSGLRQEMETSLRRELNSGIRKEVETVLGTRDLASKSDLARGLKTIPFGLSKEEVGQMIEFATRNFLRTVQGSNNNKNLSQYYFKELIFPDL